MPLGKFDGLRLALVDGERVHVFGRPELYEQRGDLRLRALSIELAVNFNTVALAYRELDSQGVIATRRGEGTFVTQAPAAADMQQIRDNKLQSLVAALFNEARRLGYSVEEVFQIVEQQRQSAQEESKHA